MPLKQHLFPHSTTSAPSGETPVDAQLPTPVHDTLNTPVGAAKPVTEVTETIAVDPTEASIEEHSDLAKSTQHVLHYPIAKSAIENVQSLNYPRLISPFMVELRKSSPVKPIFETFDNFNDSVLDRVDQLVPQLQTLEPHDIVESVSSPLRNAMENTTKWTHETEDMINDRVVTPVRKSVADFREHGGLVDSHGKAIIRGQADPIIKPINDRMGKFIDEHLAEGDPVPSEGFSNELSRSSRIISSGVQRARPVIRSAPNAMRNRYQIAYEKYRVVDDDTYLGNFRATMQATSHLTLESVRSVFGFFSWRQTTSLVPES